MTETELGGRLGDKRRNRADVLNHPRFMIQLSIVGITREVRGLRNAGKRPISGLTRQGRIQSRRP